MDIEKELTLNSVIKHAVAKYKDNIFSVSFEDNQSISFQEFNDRVNYWRNKFAEKKGPFAFYLDSSINFLIYFLAVTCNGEVAVIVDSHIESEFVVKQLANAQPKVIIASQENAEKIRNSWDVDTLDCNMPEFQIADAEDFNAASHFTDTLPTATKDNVAVILYTSGSLGNPKGVMLTHEAICNCILSNFRNTNPKYKHSYLALAPFSHIAGLGLGLIALHNGTRIVFIKSLKPNIVFSAIKQCKVEYIIASPAMFEMIYKKINYEISNMPILKRYLVKLFQSLVLFINYFSYDVGHIIARKIFKPFHQAFGESLGAFGSAGARLPKSVIDTLSSIGFYIYNIYGLTETCGCIVFNDKVPSHPDSVGSPNNNVEIKIINADSSGIGEIFLKTNQLMLGYYKDEVKTAECIQNGWFLTGDLGYLKNNYLYIRGRSKEVIINAEGKKIYPDDLESFFSEIPHIVKMCVFGIESERGEHIALCLQLADTSDREAYKNTIMEKFSEINGKLPSYMRVQHVFIENEALPVTAFGKVKKKELSKKYRSAIKQH